MPQWRGGGGTEAPRTSTVLSDGDDFPKRIEKKSELVALLEESPNFKIRFPCLVQRRFPGEEFLVGKNPHFLWKGHIIFPSLVDTVKGGKKMARQKRAI
jgi:hypothetical protein